MFQRLLAVAKSVDGQCPGSTGAFDGLACATDETALGSPWGPPHPLVKGKVQSVEECIRLCQTCARCQIIGYSQILRQCTWHPASLLPPNVAPRNGLAPSNGLHIGRHQKPCNLTARPDRLDRRFELWTYRSFELRHVTNGRCRRRFTRVEGRGVVKTLCPKLVAALTRP